MPARKSCAVGSAAMPGRAAATVASAMMKLRRVSMCLVSVAKCAGRLTARRRAPLQAIRDRASRAAPTREKEKARHRCRASSFDLAKRCRSGLLDRREHPVAAAGAHEGPHLGRFLRLIVAVGRAAGGALD